MALSPDFADDHTLITSCKHGGRIKLPSSGTKYPSYDFFQGKGSRLHVSRNGGASWTDIGPEKLKGRWQGDHRLVRVGGGGVAIVGAESGILMVNTKLTKRVVQGEGRGRGALPLVGRNGLDTRGEWVLIGWMGGGTTLGHIDGAGCRLIGRVDSSPPPPRATASGRSSLRSLGRACR